MSTPEATAGVQYEFKERKSPKLRSPEWIAYDDKGAAFILAPFGTRKDVDMKAVIRCVNSHEALVTSLRELLKQYAADEIDEFNAALTRAEAALALATE